MANDFSAGVMEAIKAKFLTVFKNRSTVNPELTPVPVTMSALLTTQTVNVSPVMDATNNCVALKVIHEVADNTSLPTSSATAITGDCDLADGDGMSLVDTDYELNYFIKESITINDDDCGNIEKFTDRVAFLMLHKKSMFVQKMNEDLINELEANKSVPTTLDIDDLTIAGGDYVLTGSEYWKGISSADTIAIFDQIARLKGLPKNYIIVVGAALAIPYQQAGDHAANDNERSYAKSFQRHQIFQDVDSLDEVIGAQSVFLIDPNAFLGYFHAEYPNVPKNNLDEYNTHLMSMPLEYYDSYRDASLNVSQVQFMNNGTPMGAKIDVKYQRKCATTGHKGKTSLKHTFEFDLNALFGFVPKASTNETGIVKILKAV